MSHPFVAPRSSRVLYTVAGAEADAYSFVGRQSERRLYPVTGFEDSRTVGPQSERVLYAVTGAEGGALPASAARATDYVRDAFILGVSGFILYMTLSIKPPAQRR
ncbi:MAG: hypothetical protein ACHREM_15095 [Polyangiales bacterium]